jgi:hypothetical protein
MPARSITGHVTQAMTEHYSCKQWNCGGCEEGDSNPHSFRNQILSLARLPVPPSSLENDLVYFGFGPADEAAIS